jgi:hypothetical protein
VRWEVNSCFRVVVSIYVSKGPIPAHRCRMVCLGFADYVRVRSYIARVIALKLVN